MKHLIVLTLALAGCSKSTPDNTPNPAPAKPAASFERSPSIDEIEQRIAKAGFKAEQRDSDDSEWPAASIELAKMDGDQTVFRASVTIDMLGSPKAPSDPTPLVELGAGTIVRLGWSAASKGPAPALAAFAKDIGVSTGHLLYTSSDLDAACKKWNLELDKKRSGGSGGTNVAYNYRFLDNDDGELSIETIDFATSPDVKLVGTTLIYVDMTDDDPALQKALRAALFDQTT